jgi:Fe-S cluster assembly protein SufD
MSKDKQTIRASDNRSVYLTYFEQFENNFSGGSQSPLNSIRHSAIEYFGKHGFPTTKDEEWRFTNISPITRGLFAPILHSTITDANRKKLDSILLHGFREHRLVFINGYYADEFSEISTNSNEVIIGNLREILESNPDLIKKYISKHSANQESAFTSLNTSFINDGAAIIIPDNTVIQEPFYIVYLSTNVDSPFVSYPRSLIIVGKNCQISIVEHYTSLSENIYFTNAVTEIEAADNSVITHTKLQTESTKSFHIHSTFFHQDRGSNVTSNTVMIGGAIARNNITSVLDGENIECTLNGLSLATGEQLIDNHTTIDHTKPNCRSHELYKAILDGNSRGVFNGKIYVKKDAQKTDAKQTNKTLLLSDQATMNTKPQLEIFADDVKCTHGATVGYLDSDSIFYLRSRGIDEAVARDILTYAFANDVINRISIESIREYTNRILYTRLKQGRPVEDI